MPVEFAAWRIGEGITPVGWSQFPDESRLESLIQQDPIGCSARTCFFSDTRSTLRSVSPDAEGRGAFLGAPALGHRVP